MPSVFISQYEIPTRNDRTLRRVVYLQNHIGANRIEQVIEAYYRLEEHGEEVTLACLAAVGEQHLRQIAEDENKSLRRVNQDFGLWVPIILTQMYDAHLVQTNRNRDNRTRNYPQRVPLLWRARVNWVGAFTKHRLIAPEIAG